MKRLTAIVTCALVLGTACASDPAPVNSEDPAHAAYTGPAVSAHEPGSRGILGPFSGAVHGKAFRGTFRIHDFAAREDGVYALADIVDITGDLTPEEERTLRQQALSIPVSSGPRLLAQQSGPADAGAPDGGPASCPVLLLQLQPLHIELLGLIVDLQRLELTVTARPGQDALLGDLLCEVAGLLDPDGLLGGPTPENLTRAADLLGDVIGALLSGVVGGLVDGLTSGRKSESSSSVDASAPPPPPAAPPVALTFPAIDGGIAVPAL